MSNGKMKVAAGNVYIKKKLLKMNLFSDWKKNSLLFLWSLDCAKEIFLSVISKHANRNCLLPSPSASTGSAKSILEMCSHLGRRKKIPPSGNSFLYLKQGDSQPGLWHRLYTDIHLSRYNSIWLMPEDSQHIIVLRKLSSLMVRKGDYAYSCHSLGVLYMGLPSTSAVLLTNLLKRWHLQPKGKARGSGNYECRIFEQEPYKVLRREQFTYSLPAKLVYMLAAYFPQLCCHSVMTVFDLLPVVPKWMRRGETPQEDWHTSEESHPHVNGNRTPERWLSPNCMSNYSTVSVCGSKGSCLYLFFLTTSIIIYYFRVDVFFSIIFHKNYWNLIW